MDNTVFILNTQQLRKHNAAEGDEEEVEKEGSGVGEQIESEQERDGRNNVDSEKRAEKIGMRMCTKGLRRSERKKVRYIMRGDGVPQIVRQKSRLRTSRRGGIGL